jgi:3-oxoacyl-[acyl-carrier-protein] synthase-1
MTTEDTVITGIGMASALGPQAKAACAAARAGIMRAAPLEGIEVLDEPTGELIPVAGFEAFGCTGFVGLGRLARLGELALRDLMNNAGMEADNMDRLGCALALPGGYYWRTAHLQELTPLNDLPAAAEDIVDVEAKKRNRKITSSIFQRLSKLAGVPLQPEKSLVVLGEQSAFGQALHAGCDMLASRAYTQVLVGGIGSFVNIQELEAVSALGLLKNTASPIGMMPGEAAAFLLLERRDLAQERKATIHATIGASPSLQKAANHRFDDQPITGKDLAEVVSTTAQSASRTPGLLIGNLNGDYYRSQEWGHALVRLPEDLREARQLFPAESFGEVGAAFGGVAACMAIRAFLRKYALTDTALVWASGDDGGKSAFLLQAA